MAKWLFWGLVIFIVYRLLRGSARRSDAQAHAHTSPKTPPVQQMVACDHCGVYLPEMESLLEAGQHYCCEAHRRAGRGTKRP